MLTIVTLTLLAGCQKHRQVVIPEVKALTESVYASAVIKPVDEYRASSSIPGIMDKIWIEEGDEVKAGDPLFRIRNTTSGISAENARLAYELALENYKGRGKKLKELELLITERRESMLLDSVNYLRQLNLWEQGVGARVDLDAKKLAWLNSRSAYLTALNRYDQASNELETAFRQAKNNLEAVNRNNADYTVHARLDGYVYAVLREEGEYVGQLQEIAVLGRKDDFYLEMLVDERDIASIIPGQPVLLTMDSYPDSVFRGEVSRIKPMMDEVSQTFIVEGRFLSAPPRLYPNLSAEANIVIGRKKKTLVIPASCLIDRDKVISEDGDTLHVVPGIRSLEEVEILSGLSEGDRIIKPD